MAITTYAELVARVAATLNRDDLAGEIPELIDLAHQDLYPQVWLRSSIKRRVAVLNEDFEGLPTDFLEEISLKLLETGSQRVIGSIQSVQPALMDLKKRYPANGYPTVYSILGKDLTFHPAPLMDGTLSMELTHYTVVPRLSDSNPTNIILQEYPALYLYGTLIQSAPFVREDERITLWTAMFDRVLQQLRKENPKVSYIPAPLGSEVSLMTCRRSFDIYGGGHAG
jgi:hypothetical protein